MSFRANDYRGPRLHAAVSVFVSGILAVFFPDKLSSNALKSRVLRRPLFPPRVCIRIAVYFLCS